MSTFLAALGLGLIFNAVPGAIFAETVRHGVRPWSIAFSAASARDGRG